MGGGKSGKMTFEKILKTGRDNREILVKIGGDFFFLGRSTQKGVKH